MLDTTKFSAATVKGIAAALLKVGGEALKNTPNGSVPKSFKSHVQPPADCGDALFMWVQRVIDSDRKSFPNESLVRNTWSECSTGFVAVIYGIGVYRSCYPIMKDNVTKPVFPSKDEIDKAAGKLIEDMAALKCALGPLTKGTLTGELTSSGIEGYNDVVMRTSDWTPLPPQGGTAGWVSSIAVLMRGCCNASDV